VESKNVDFIEIESRMVVARVRLRRKGRKMLISGY
jgi:hypothetical protein